jgi:hypothetical protein
VEFETGTLKVKVAAPNLKRCANEGLSVVDQGHLPELRGVSADCLRLLAFWHCLDNDEADLELEEAILKDEAVCNGVCDSLQFSHF